jgi:transposase
MSTVKSYQRYEPKQAFLLPPSPTEWLPEDHLAYFILDVVETLDLRPIDDALQSKDARGQQPYAPKMMVALLLYGSCVGVLSSRRMERATYEDVAFRVLAAGHHPHFTTINEFGKEHRASLAGLFVQVLRLCQKAGMVKLGHVALDGTKIQGNASKHKAMSYERMLKSEAELQKEIDALLRQAQETDASEDARFGEGRREEDLPAELRRREGRLAKIREAKVRLEKEAAQARALDLRGQATRARERAETHHDPTERKRAATVASRRAERARALDPKADDDDLDPPVTGDGLPMHRPNTTTEGAPDAKAQMNFTDPDSRIMESGGAFCQGYNGQAAVDEGHQIIVAQGVSNLAPDNGYLMPMLAQIRSNCGTGPSVVTADAGYWTPDAPQACVRLGTDPYISTHRQKHGETEDPLTGSGQDEDKAREQMRAKLRTDQGRRIYARRKAVVEPVFGQIKEARGFRRFLMRGLDAVRAEWAMICTGHNLLKLYRFAGP